jgi:hypothetical protein
MQQKDTFRYGLIAKTPTLEDAIDYARDRPNIKFPDRRSKREAMSLARLNMFQDQVNGKLLENQQSQVAHELTRTEHSLSQETVPGRVLDVQPSPSADDALWAEANCQAQKHQENQKERALRHRVDDQAQEQLGEVRRGNLSDYHFQGMRNHVLIGEVPSEHRETLVPEKGPAFGQVVLVPRATHPALPRAAGYAWVAPLAANRELNNELGPDPRLTGKKVGGQWVKEANSYDSHRRAANI